MITQPEKQTAADRMKWNQQTASESIARLQVKLADNLKSFNDGGSVCYGHVGSIARINELLFQALGYDTKS